jgi:PDZ domain-containing protein
MFKKIFTYIKNTIVEEYKFIIFLLLLYIILNFPVNYYITTGGGTSDVSSRIEVTNKNKSKGSFNISYVKQLDGTILSYGLSYIIPTWEKESADLYKYTESDSIEDINFRSDLDLLTANGTATYWAYTLANKQVELTSSKLYVISVYEDYENPLKVKDQILSVNDKTFETVEEYSSYIQTLSENDKVNIKVLRNNKEKTLTATIYYSETSNRLVLGVALQYVREYKTDPEVKIKFNSSESGPSGGLITTLEIYNQLTKKDLTKGLKIAGTGTIEEDGTIGQIGGVEHKILGAVSDKADIFLVPSGKNYKAAKKYIKKKNLKIKLIKVDTIQDAINKLEGLS